MVSNSPTTTPADGNPVPQDGSRPALPNEPALEYGHSDLGLPTVHRDQLYAKPEDDSAHDGPFAFTDAVAGVFPDMLKRSIPGYGASLLAIESLARRHVRANSRCYDLGCSLGAATWAMARGIKAPGCRIVAIDKAPAMIARCRDVIPEMPDHVSVDLECADVCDADIVDASMVVMNYTLQFIAPQGRQPLLDRVAAGMRSNGVFVLSEKIEHEDPAVNELLISLHHDFKRQHAYSDLEISRKRAALENVLIPDTLAQHRRRLESAGFRDVAVWMQHFNFVSIIATR